MQRWLRLRCAPDLALWLVLTSPPTPPINENTKKPIAPANISQYNKNLQKFFVYNGKTIIDVEGGTTPFDIKGYFNNVIKDPKDTSEKVFDDADKVTFMGALMTH